MENIVCLDARLSGDGSMASYEKCLLDEIDSYWDDLNARLTISRMVSDSVIKGMVTAVSEEAAEKITLKEAEVAFLSERLKHYEPDGANDSAVVTEAGDSCMRVEFGKNKNLVRCRPLNSSVDVARLERFWVAAEEKVHRLKERIMRTRSMDSLGRLHVIDECSVDLEGILSAVHEEVHNMICSVRASSSEQQLNIEIHDSMEGLRDELEMKMCEQKEVIATVNKKWQEKIGELSAMRQELYAMSKCLSSSELGLLVSHNKLENSEECVAGKRRDHFGCKVSAKNNTTCPSHVEEVNAIESKESGKPASTDSSLLKCMTKDELITYFKSEETKMKRQHDLALQEKTEELFSLKREMLKEKGYSPSHIRRDKEVELLVRKIPEFISKLDYVLLGDEHLPIIQDDLAIFASLKGRLDTLICQNQQLQGFLKDKTNEARSFTLQVSDTENQLSQYSIVKSKLLRQIAELQLDLEDVKIEAIITDEINNSVFSKLVEEFKSDMEGLEWVTKTEQELCTMVYREFASDVLYSMNCSIAEGHKEMKAVAARLQEKDNTLISQVEENMKLKLEITSLLELMKEREKFASDAGSTLTQQKEQFDLVCQQLDILKGRVSEQEMLNLDAKKESEFLRSRLEEALQQIHQYEADVSDINLKFRTVSDALEEAEKQKVILYCDIQEKHKALTSAVAMEEEQKKLLETIISSISEISRAIVNCECRLLDDIKTNESRLRLVNDQSVQLVQHATLLKKKDIWYKQILKWRCSDLQKAEIEVDLLGDEVDTLVSLLERIYIALEHYSPVLEHYPGVVEILKLIRREVKGEITKLV